MTEPESESSAQLLPVVPFDLVVFGAAGDLSLRKLIPSLFHRWQDGQIPPESRIVGTARTALDTDRFRALARESFEKFRPDETLNEADWAAFAAHLHYVPLDSAADNQDWSALADLLPEESGKQLVFYLALPPQIFGSVCRNIDKAGLNRPGARVVLEKPIGKNLASARAVNDDVGSVFDEHNIFRIDHYLGKETVQNLLVLRFMNSIFEPVWNANAIDHVQITVAESIGTGGRAGYYDTAGALRDMVQNHLLQLLCLVAMEPPFDLEADTVRDEKIKVLRALRPLSAATIREDTVRGQYDVGAVDGEAVPGYTDELEDESNTETFVAVRTFIDNWRWKGVPFYIRTGKRMSGRRSEIVIQFKNIAHSLVQSSKQEPTRLIIRLQPDEGMRLMLMTKDPGPGGMRLRYVPLNLSYADEFEARYPDAYERLLMAVVRGDLGLFMRRDEVEAAWNWVDGILAAWKEDETPVSHYAAGTDGPVESALMLGKDNRKWFDGRNK